MLGLDGTPGMYLLFLSLLTIGPKQLANITLGPVVSMVRVPGGRASLAIKALAGMQAVLNSGTILVIHHTGKF
jgi:hypothetical protein